ncbi:carbohydrate deacetylase [Paenibacillus ginsengarvi]|uniref:carbohydrate deacetylase n=1 Tax=Paenibacillus ginsengarvi TaxID=400777 RepID=UPI0013155902|nr:ChbG/HpnK family deacetylase [Paenibacillus ginsengarvi]
MAKYLIVNADDFGFSRRVNDGIWHAHTAGAITSATLMANMPGFDHAVWLAQRTPSLGVGLHINLTYGKPLSPKEDIPSLVGLEGYFSDRRVGWNPEEAELEIERQLDKLLAARMTPTHLDTHHHIHIEVPSIYAILKKIALRRRIPMRRHPWAETGGDAPLQTERLIMDTFDDGNGTARLLRYLEDLPEGTTEIMCHPGYGEDKGTAASQGSAARAAELQTFTDPAVREAIRQLDIRLIHYGQLADVPASPVPDVPAIAETAPEQVEIFLPQSGTTAVPLSVPAAGRRRRKSSYSRGRGKRRMRIKRRKRKPARVHRGNRRKR